MQNFSISQIDGQFEADKKNILTQLQTAKVYGYVHTTSYQYSGVQEQVFENINGKFEPDAGIPDHLRFSYTAPSGIAAQVFSDLFSLSFLKPGVMSEEDLLDRIYVSELFISNTKFVQNKRFKLYNTLKPVAETVEVSTHRHLYVNPSVVSQIVNLPSNAKIGKAHASSAGFVNPTMDSLIVFSEPDKVYGQTAGLFVYIGGTQRKQQTSTRDSKLNVGIFYKLDLQTFEQNRVIY